MAIADIKSKGGWKGETRFCLGISVGQNHSGESLAAIVDWINKSSFEKGIIDLSDTLNRYNFMRDGASEDQSFTLARQQGDKWLSENSSTLKRLKKPIEIIRWDTWLQDPAFEKVKANVQTIHAQSLPLQYAVLQDVKAFLIRKGTAASEKDHLLCRQYLLEEIAGHSLLYRIPDLAALYPGKQLESYKAIRSGRVGGVSAGLAQSPFVRLVVHSYERSLTPARHLVA